MTTSSDRRMPDFCNRRHPFHYTTALNILRLLEVDLNRVVLLAAGEYENYKGEIREQDPPPGATLGSDTPITLKVGYSSAIDQMPYQFFYGLQEHPSRGSAWEQHARELMAPFDAAIIRHDAEARFQILRYLCAGIDASQLEQFLGLFDFVPDKTLLSSEEQLVWAYLMPTFHAWAGNPGRVAELLHFFLGYDFRIVENVSAEYVIDDGIRYHLGSISGRLGKESIVGRTFIESDSTYQVIVSDVPPEDVADLLPGKTKRRKLEWLLDICLPSHLDHIVTIATNRRVLRLGDKRQGGCLGHSSHL